MARPALPGFAQIVENRITEAMARGEFDNLPGAGKPLDLDGDLLVPEEERMAFRIMKNAGCLPPQVERLAELERLISAADGDDPVDEARTGRRLRALVVQLEAEGRNATAARAWRDYEAALARRLGTAKR
jgi:DnaJ homologue, subfamily C, member 28, conserved domain